MSVNCPIQLNLLCLYFSYFRRFRFGLLMLLGLHLVQDLADWGSVGFSGGDLQKKELAAVEGIENFDESSGRREVLLLID